MAKLLYEVKDEIAWIRLNRPEVLNALSSEELGAFVDALREAADDPEVKAIIISSVGDSFCAGEDLKIALEEYPQIKTGEIHPILDIVEDITEGLQAIPRIIRMARKVVIASVRGLAVGARAGRGRRDARRRPMRHLRTPSCRICAARQSRHPAQPEPRCARCRAGRKHSTGVVQCGAGKRPVAHVTPPMAFRCDGRSFLSRRISRASALALPESSQKRGEAPSCRGL